jgi:hypothetical protein
LTLYLGVSLNYFTARKCEWEKQVREGSADQTVDDFLVVLESIRKTMFSQQFDNAQAGVFKEGLTSRYLKLQENTQLSTPNSSDDDGKKDDSKEFKITLKLE